MYDIDKSLTMLRVYEAFMGVIICGIDFQTVSLTFGLISLISKWIHFLVKNVQN